MNTLPGIFDDHCELMAHGDQLYGMHQGKALPFRELPWKLRQLLRIELEDDLDASRALDLWGIDDPDDRLEQFAWCRFGGVDNAADLTADGQLEPDFHQCGARGRCPFEGIICVNKHRLTKRERQVLTRVARGELQKNIAADLGISEVTVAKQRKSLFNKTGARSSVDLTRFALEHNYISYE